MKKFTVMMPWAWSGDPSDEEGTYCDTFEAVDEGAAKLACATAMADSAEKCFANAADRKQYIDSRVEGWADVVEEPAPVLFYPCIAARVTGKHSQIVGKAMPYDEARAYLERHYPAQWRQLAAGPQPVDHPYFKHMPKPEGT